ncbi:Phosphoenolpyruvate carboxykinase [ATP] [Oceanibacterium hippocampi]|uniref:Phosphoenolpyruvate carboxykinase (ATP) n=1 Tax=Oceanibacterium hippocampi TaxID=745714 RepID=A0A1Y5RNZ3_9PROT|nr:phosphoenolpyruvate carboxykinase [Oceanibacterium hippocampi]SLN22000.1 Phosphoenolpyruvate carboxykinase [ATP] [Oceanibacterium hippocampi]
MNQIGIFNKQYGLEKQGLVNVKSVYWNLNAPRLYEEAVRRGEGIIADGGPLVVETGQHTGRSANDKFIVKNEESADTVWWGAVNKPFEETRFAELHRRVLAYYQGRDVFVQDCFAGADPNFRLSVRVVTETAWHSLFTRNMLLVPDRNEHQSFEPAFTILQAPGLKANPETDGTRSDVFVLINFAEKLVLIGGTSYAGEIKKSVFSILNYLLPARNVMPMHCSINVGDAGDAAIFFGLSGTGKTTLSADSSRMLIGDDEHGWSDNGTFNFEGGCYAKVIRLSEEAEPEIYETTRRFGTVLENVIFDPEARDLDLDDATLTENTRACYPIDFIPNASVDGIAGHPKNIIMLTADAFGVLPPISKLTPEQAMYHFLSGYTAKLAGTEKGLGKEPQATFSTCFGAPFMPRHPSVYAELLGKKIAEHGVTCWLVNTGWTGGEFGTGERMPIKYTRALVNSALAGELKDAPTAQDPHFGLAVPQSCPGVPSEILNPRETWADKAAYDAKARELVDRFIANFTQFEDYVDANVLAAAPDAA